MPNKTTTDRIMQNEAEAESVAAEHEMFASVLFELFLGVLSENEPQEWHDTAVRQLSRGAAPKLWASLTTAHAVGMRLDPRAVAQAEAIDLLCGSGGPPSDRYGFAADLVVLVVTRDVADAVLRGGNDIWNPRCAENAQTWRKEV